MLARSWVAEYWATGDMPLLGGIRKNHSSRWGTQQEAQRYLENSLKVNRGAGRPCKGRVVPKTAIPEIFVHCGEDAQAVNAICPGCRKELTFTDARDYGDAHAVEVGIWEL